MLGNAAAAAVLAVLAAALSYFVRAPAVRHAAWVLVLLKLVTPPLVGLPLPVLPASWAPQPEAREAGVKGGVTPPLLVTCPPAVAAASGPSLTDGLWLAWLAGALGWFAWQGRRIVRFRRRVRAAEDAPAEVRAAATRIARALGIGRPPAVRLAPGI